MLQGSLRIIDVIKRNFLPAVFVCFITEAQQSWPEASHSRCCLRMQGGEKKFLLNGSIIRHHRLSQYFPFVSSKLQSLLGISGQGHCRTLSAMRNGDEPIRGHFRTKKKRHLALRKRTHEGSERCASCIANARLLRKSMTPKRKIPGSGLRTIP